MTKYIIIFLISVASVSAGWLSDIGVGSSYGSNWTVYTASSVAYSEDEWKAHASLSVETKPSLDTIEGYSSTSKVGYDNKIHKLFELFAFSSSYHGVTDYIVNRWDIGGGVKYMVPGLSPIGLSFSLAPVFSRYITLADKSNAAGISTRAKITIPIFSFFKITAMGFIVNSYVREKIVTWATTDISVRLNTSDRLDLVAGQATYHDLKDWKSELWVYLGAALKFK